MASITQQFQNLWAKILWENPDDTFDSKLEQLQYLADDGADLSFPFESFSCWEPHTPLYYLTFIYGGSYYTLTTDQCDQLLSFLLLNGVVPDQEDIKRATVFPKVLEKLLYFAREEDIKLYQYHQNPLCLEVLLGFPSVRLDQESCYEVVYTKDEIGIYSRVYNCIPIEECLMNYARDYGSAFTTIEQRKEVLRILKKNSTLTPRLGLIHNMLDLIGKEEDRNRFKEAYDYWKSL